MNEVVSIILPVLNETEIDQKIDFLVPYINSYRYEIIVVDDSNDDQFFSLKKDIEKRQDVRLKLIKGSRQGKGAAVKKAAFASTGSIVFYIDADFRIPLDNISLFIDLISRQGYDLAIGQRPFDKTPRTLLRLMCSFGLSSIVRLLIFQSAFFYDTQCGFKAFRGNVLKKFSARQTIGAGMFDIEYLFMARANKLKIAKVAVMSLPEIRTPRTNLGRSISCALSDLLKIKLKSMRQFYLIRNMADTNDHNA